MPTTQDRGDYQPLSLYDFTAWLVVAVVMTRDVPYTGFLNGASTLKQSFILPLSGSKY